MFQVQGKDLTADLAADRSAGAGDERIFGDMVLHGVDRGDGVAFNSSAMSMLSRSLIRVRQRMSLMLGTALI